MPLPTSALYDNTIPVSRSFTVAAGSHTFELGAFSSGPGANAGDQVLSAQMHAVFYPAS
jgi:hypothetical protein